MVSSLKELIDQPELEHNDDPNVFIEESPRSSHCMLASVWEYVTDLWI
jgi:hypothetical protein